MIRQQFGIRDAGSRELNVKLFVVGRFAARFSDYPNRDVRAAWGTWPQILNLIADTHEQLDMSVAAGSHPVDWLHSQLAMADQTSAAHDTEVVVDTLDIGGIRVLVRSPASDRSAN